MSNGEYKGKPTLLTPSEVAELLLVSPITVRQWAHNGKLPSRSTPGGHRRFTLDDIHNFAVARGISVDNNKKLERRKILVIDDDHAVNAFVKDLISMHNEDYEVYSAYDGFEAGMLVQQHLPDTIVLDVMMPGMDGFDVCKMIKKQPGTQHIRIIGMTGHYTPEIEKRMLQMGADTCMAKPINSQTLINALEAKHTTELAN